MFRAVDASRCVFLMLPGVGGVGGVRGWGGVQGFHFEAKMDACAHFFSLPPWPYLGSYIMLVNTGRPMLGPPVPSICSFMWGGAAIYTWLLWWNASYLCGCTIYYEVSAQTPNAIGWLFLSFVYYCNHKLWGAILHLMNTQYQQLNVDLGSRDLRSKKNKHSHHLT